jgi:glycosyltransferase involved in cell wall biosynthesis
MAEVHLVVPCFQESARIGVFLPGLCRAMADLGGVSILVVEDGSDVAEVARMQSIIESFRGEFPCLLPLHVLPENRGKGGAVYAGWAAAQQAEWLGFVDADGSCSAEEVARLIRLARSRSAESPTTAFFASRIKMLGRRVQRLLKRHLLGRVYATLVSEMLRVPVYDSQCGLKLLPRQAFERVAAHLVVTGFAFDVELMVALLDSGCRIEEVPIDWQEVAGGKVSLLRDSWRMARDVARIRARRERWRLNSNELP